MPSIHREATRQRVEQMIFRLPDVQYSIFNPKTTRQEEEWKNRKGQEDDNKANLEANVNINKPVLFFMFVFCLFIIL